MKHVFNERLSYTLFSTILKSRYLKDNYLMNKLKTLSISTALLSSITLITACSSDDGGSSAASVPANAIVIDSTNAETTVLTAANSAASLESAFSALGVETTQSLSLEDTLDIISPLVNNLSNNASQNSATGIAIDEPCPDGGSISGSATESTNGTTTTDSGSVTFSSCNYSGFIINGSFSFTDTSDLSTGDYSDNASGSITMSDANSNSSFSFTGFVYAETGDNFNFTYTTTQLTYAINFVANGTAGGGFLVTLTAPIVESNGDRCPESGHLTITGANGTTAEGIYNGDGTMTIKANGEIVNTIAACFG